MGRTAKIRHRRRRRAEIHQTRAAIAAGTLSEKVLKPLQQRRRLPLGVVEVAPADGVRQLAPELDSLDDALASALRDLGSVPSRP